MNGSVLTSFAALEIHGARALAMDVDHALWYVIPGFGTIQHYARDGTCLGSNYYGPLGQALGGEIAAISAVPEPATLAMWLDSAGFVRRGPPTTVSSPISQFAG